MGDEMTRTINYGSLMHRAMRELIRNVLRDVASNGLPGNHHFFIAFDTTHPNTKVPGWLRDRYPKDITIVLQHWFDQLDVSEAGFSVTLKFSGKPERLYVPFDAITTFSDPSVEFGLRFETKAGADGAKKAPKDKPPAKTEQKDAEIVSLDSFRK